MSIVSSITCTIKILSAPNEEICELYFAENPIQICLKYREIGEVKNIVNQHELTYNWFYFKINFPRGIHLTWSIHKYCAHGNPHEIDSDFVCIVVNLYRGIWTAHYLVSSTVFQVGTWRSSRRLMHHSFTYSCYSCDIFFPALPNISCLQLEFPSLKVTMVKTNQMVSWKKRQPRLVIQSCWRLSEVVEER